MNPIQNLRQHITKDYLERLSNMALAAAGFSSGLIVLLVQAKGQAHYNEISVWSAILSLMLSLGGWQYFLPYILYGEKTYEHINLYLVAFLQVFIVLALFIAVCALVWKLMWCAGVALIVTGIGLVIFVVRHNWKVANYSGSQKA
ncbi:hypothetical protein [Gilvimarinus sp. DA14]|uniref:hypothetical protein n=1 Tax=Gilvimarinus sp. DA14 TaxID=2956798 RepID=UPI0020B80566|nr:hypothetical protein [Gilvimarinus sp. DA14]UTF60450.1 hypothetical protein NHM04_01250 [Gilvimarinus sp. DA14]